MYQIIKALPTRATLMLALLTLMMLSGCASRESKLIGKWKMDASALTASMPQNERGSEMAKKLLENATLDLKEDKTFAMTMMMSFKGNWTIDDNADTVTLNMTKIGDMDISKMPNAGKTQKPMKPMVMNIGADNKTLTLVVPQTTMPNGAAPKAADGLKFIKQ